MIASATAWVKRNTLTDSGVIVHSSQREAYPEVTGYFIPTLLQIGEDALAKQYANWLTTVQAQDGSFGSPNGGIGFAFDTAQVIRGWVAMLHLMPQLEKPLRRACDWLLAASDPSTARLLVPQAGGDWSLGRRGEVNEAIHLYALAPLNEAGEKLGERRYSQFVSRALSYYLSLPSLCSFQEPNALTHFFAYTQEALLELGHEELARRGMSAVARFQQEDGAVPAYSDVSWVCSTGLAQLAKVWYLIGEGSRADAAVNHLASLQNPSGGFFGSYGPGADYFPNEEISWCLKYVLEAFHGQIVHHFDRTAGDYASDIAPEDGRVQALLKVCGNLDGKRILDAGCGKGRYSKLLKRLYPAAEITASDVSKEMLKQVPPGITTVQSGILSTPFADGTFDLVLCIEALEHAVHIVPAIRELVRVLAPDGQLIIIDKNAEKLGALKTPHWEKWFGRGEILDGLKREGLEAVAEDVGYDQHQADGLFIMWHGRKAVKTLAQGVGMTITSQATTPLPVVEAIRRDRIKSFNPQILLGDRLGISLYCLFVEEHVSGRHAFGEELYLKFMQHFDERGEHSPERFRHLIDSIRSCGFDPVQGVWANPQERTLINGSHRCAVAIVTGITDLPYYLRFGDNRAPDDLFARIFTEAELNRLLQYRDMLIEQCEPLVSLQCRVRKVVRESPASFSAPFSSKGRLDAIRLYQGFDELGLVGKRPVESRFATYGIADWVTREMEVLEIGCNNGFLSLLTARRAAHVTAFDADPSYIAIGKMVQRHLRITNCDLLSSTFNSFSFTKRYDAVFACAVHGWLNIPFQGFVSVVLASLKPGGLFLFETHELDCHPEAAEQRAYLLNFFEVIRCGFIDDADPSLYQSEFREYLVLRRK